MTRPFQSIFHVLVGGLAASIGGHASVEAAASKGPKGDSSCFEEGRAYVDENVTVSAPNGAHVGSAGACQEECAGVPACSYFTFYAGRGPERGACWLLGPGSTSKPDATASSGPRDCADVAKGAGWVESITDTVGGTLGAASGAASASHSATSSLSWWAWCSLALVVVAAGAGTASALGYTPKALMVPLMGKSRGAKIGSEEDSEEDSDEELAAAGAAALAAAAAPTHSVPLPTYSTASYTALPSAAPPLPMAQVTPRGSTMPRPSVMPHESFHAGGARAPAPGGPLSGQSFAGQPMMGMSRQPSAAVMPGQGFAGIPSQQSFAGIPHQQSFAGVPHESFAGLSQQQSFSLNH